MKRLPALALAAAGLAGPSPRAGADDFAPGPAPGSPLPALGLPDQTGRLRAFDDLRGPEGLLLLVHRSADW
jgi:hypothetical protein